jgi:HPt (histidine-containing phosphotransfer) domain-containing protein
LMPVDMVKKQLAIFLGDDEQAMSSLSKVIDSEMREVLVESAHTMKGVCLLLGLTAMANTLSRIEYLALDSTMDNLKGLLVQFKADIEQTRQILNSELVLH